jgi:hypothetical protein
MQSIFGKGSLYGVRATLRPDPDIMLGTSVDALAWLAKMGGPQASVTLLPTRKNSSAVCDWLAHISSGAGPMIPVGSSPWRHLTSQRPGRPSPISCCGCACDRPGSARTAATFLSWKGRGWRFCWPTRSWCVRSMPQTYTMPPTARISQQDVEAWILHAVHPSSRYMRALGDAASRYPDVFDTNVRLQLALQIRQGAAAGASGQIKPT